MGISKLDIAGAAAIPAGASGTAAFPREASEGGY